MFGREISGRFQMAARVALLLAFTSVFALAWESDQQPGERARTLAAAKHRYPVQAVSVHPVSQLVVVSSTSTTSFGVTISSESDFSHCVLPEGICPGKYRVVDDRGSVGWVTIATERDSAVADPTETSATKSVDFLTSQSSFGRWYFIRVEASAVASIPAGRSTLR
jgi:hypothetical protein